MSYEGGEEHPPALLDLCQDASSIAGIFRDPMARRVQKVLKIMWAMVVLRL